MRTNRPVKKDITDPVTDESCDGRYGDAIINWF